MNKAFIKEPEQSANVPCPRCGSIGIQVAEATVLAQIGAAGAEELADVAYFCPFPRCEVAYFDALERYVGIERLQTPVYPKTLAAPICPCFGLTTEDIDADLAEGHPRRVRELLAKSKSPAAQCAQKSPTGRCCMPEVQKYYLRGMNS